MTDLADFHAWLATASAAPVTPATPAPAPAPAPPARVAPPDRVGEYLAKMNAAAAAAPNPLITPAQRATIAAAGPPPNPTGDHVADYQAMERWKHRRNRDPYGLMRP